MYVCMYVCMYICMYLGRYVCKVKLYGYGVSKNSYSEFRDCSLFREFLK